MLEIYCGFLPIYIGSNARDNCDSQSDNPSIYIIEEGARWIASFGRHRNAASRVQNAPNLKRISYLEEVGE